MINNRDGILLIVRIEISCFKIHEREREKKGFTYDSLIPKMIQNTSSCKHEYFFKNILLNDVLEKKMKSMRLTSLLQ